MRNRLMKKIASASAKIDKLIKSYHDARTLLPIAILTITTIPIVRRELIDKDNVDGLFDSLTANHNLDVFQLTTKGILTPATRKCLVLLHQWRSARDDPQATLEQMQLMRCRWGSEQRQLIELQSLCQSKFQAATMVVDLGLLAQWSGFASIVSQKLMQLSVALRVLDQRLVDVAAAIITHTHAYAYAYVHAQY